MNFIFAALASDKFCKDRFGESQAVGRMNFDIMNNLGGSLAIGHPFGATGSRLVSTGKLN